MFLAFPLASAAHLPLRSNSTCYLQVVEFQISSDRLKVADKPAGVFRIAVIERKHKRRITNFEELLDKCQAWELPKGTKYNRVECMAMNLDNPDNFLENLSWLRSIDALVCNV